MSVIEEKKKSYVGEEYAPVPEYSRVSYAQPHWSRRKEILQSHPSVQDLHQNDLYSAVWVFVHVSLLVLTATIVQKYDCSFLTIFAAAYFVGAFISHGLWVLVHELTHDLVTPSAFVNTMLLLICNVPHIVPSAVSFRYYHRIHHSHLNETYGDPDMPLPIEDKIFGHSIIGKATWLSLFSIFQTFRLLAMPQPIEWAIVCNWLFNGAFSYVVLSHLGTKAFTYLLLSSFLSVGLLLHPLGARWIAEHWAVKPLQETYSYYGMLNLFMFNIGYHNEHHDFPGIPWSKLPELKESAPEFYEPLYQHTSYLALLWTFIMNKKFTLTSRVVRWPKGDKRAEQEKKTVKKEN